MSALLVGHSSIIHPYHFTLSNFSVFLLVYYVSFHIVPGDSDKLFDYLTVLNIMIPHCPTLSILGLFTLLYRILLAIGPTLMLK